MELDSAAERTVKSHISLARETTAQQAPSIGLLLRPRPLLNAIRYHAYADVRVLVRSYTTWEICATGISLLEITSDV